MGYEISEVRTASWPDEKILSTAFAESGVPLTDLIAAVRGYVCDAPLLPDYGYQQSLARGLERHLESAMRRIGVRTVSTRVSPRLNECADLAFSGATSPNAVYVEIEFRPNVEKDLVKFQIAHNCGRLALGILIVATDRGAINASYTTMPEFAKTLRLIEEFKPDYPLLLIGVGGAHAQA